jgi:hypothetical protein
LRYSLLLLILFITLLSSHVYAASTKIYVWRSDDGVLVFSDSPISAAEEVEISEPNIGSSVNTSMLNLTPKVIKNDYQVEIEQPKHKATIRDNTGSVYIAGIIKPIFKQSLNIQLYLNGSPYGPTQSHPMFVLRNIDRGEHIIKMQLLNEKGKVIASSKSITFYMHRSSVNNAN